MSIFAQVVGGPASPSYDGAVLTADLHVGDLVVYVDDTADFDEDASLRDGAIMLAVELNADGTMNPNTGTTMLYRTCDDETDAITLLAASTVAAVAGDHVYIQNPLTGLAVGDSQIMVVLDDADPTGDALVASLDLSLLDGLSYPDLTDHAVELDEDEDGQLVIRGLPGLSQSLPPSPAVSVKAAQDGTTVTAPGFTVVNLRFEPIPDTSVHLYWNGLEQPESAYTLDRYAVNALDVEGRMRAGDVLDVKYLYDSAAQHVGSFTYLATATIPNSGVVNVPRSVTIPAGVAVGDAFVFGISTGPSFGNNAGACTDPRMLAQQTADTMFGSAWPLHLTVGYGRLSTLAALSFTMFASDGANEGWVTFYRVDGPIGATYSVGDPGGVAGACPPCLPAVVGGDDNLSILAVAGNNIEKMQGTPAQWSNRSPGSSRVSMWDSHDPAGFPSPHLTNTLNQESGFGWLSLCMSVT